MPQSGVVLERDGDARAPRSPQHEVSFIFALDPCRRRPASRTLTG